MAGPGRWNDPWQRFPASKPLPTTDGIATSKKRGAMAEQWWSKRFTEVLDQYGLGGRMQRGRRYARTGQLVSFDVRPGQLLAQVQGSRPTPYLVTVDAPTTSASQWEQVDAAMASRVKFVARLLAGDVPPELEDVFADAGVALFPARWSDIVAHCTCPDRENPCKHIAATLYVFADRLDDDPWLLLEWRGRTRDQILGPLVARGNAPRTSHDDVTSRGDVGDTAAAVAPWWPLDPTRIHPGAQTGKRAGLGASGMDQLLNVDPPDPPDAVLTRLAELDVRIQDSPVTDLFTEAYRIVTTED